MASETSEEPPLTYADLGIPTKEHVTTGILGKSRKLSDLERWEWVFVAVTGLGLPATLILSLYKLFTTPTADPDFVFALLLVINTLFCMYYVLHGVLRERPYEIMILTLATGVVLLYSILNYALSKQDTVKLVRLILACIIGPFIIALGIYISRQYYLSGNLIFRTVGANSALQDMCKALYFFYGVLKLDLQLGMSMVVLILSTSTKVDAEDIVVLSVGGVFVIVWFVIGYLGARMENKILTYIFFGGCPLEPAYIIYKVVKSAQNHRSELLATCTYVCAGLALIVHVLLIIAMVIVFRNYGKGLKGKAYGTGEAHYVDPNNSINNQSDEVAGLPGDA
ncbi:uncharacterized protein LOC135474689 isoform X2 [Liolophura sinensis]|uniref:uncharacterized protein LOC135474689 isoform X2 n=1 Tax=Liolophura sinensis TaxID=3198878 RepID=UPI0031597202